MARPNHEYVNWMLKLGRATAAIDSLKSAIAEDPNDDSVWRLICECHLSQNDFVQARACAERALKINPTEHANHYVLGLVFWRDGDFECWQPDETADGVRDTFRQMMRAEMCFEEAIRLYGSNADYFSALGWARYQRGDAKSAAMSLAKALAIDPGDARSLTLLAEMQRAGGEVAVALETVSSALQQEPTNSVLHSNRAEILSAAGRQPEAVAAAREGLRLDPESEFGSSVLLEVLRRRWLPYRLCEKIGSSCESPGNVLAAIFAVPFFSVLVITGTLVDWSFARRVALATLATVPGWLLFSSRAAADFWICLSNRLQSRALLDARRRRLVAVICLPLGLNYLVMAYGLVSGDRTMIALSSVAALLGPILGIVLFAEMGWL